MTDVYGCQCGCKTSRAICALSRQHAASLSRAKTYADVTCLFALISGCMWLIGFAMLFARRLSAAEGEIHGDVGLAGMVLVLSGVVVATMAAFSRRGGQAALLAVEAAGVRMALMQNVGQALELANTLGGRDGQERRMLGRAATELLRDVNVLLWGGIAPQTALDSLETAEDGQSAGPTGTRPADPAEHG